MNATGNGTDSSDSGGDGVLEYDPSVPAPYGHRTMELVAICVVNGLTLLVILIRVWVRKVTLKRFRRDDYWIMAAGLLLIFPHWVAQIGTNRYGSGLHPVNIPDDWAIPYWQFSWGWVGYYLVSSTVKVSTCSCLLEILPHPFLVFRRLVYCLCFIIVALGISEASLWLFQCRPFLSNFIYSVPSDYCLDIDIPRYVWVGLSVPIDLAIVWIPIEVLRRTRFKSHERKVLMCVFGANALGTIICAFGAYGIWVNRTTSNQYVDPYTNTVFVITNDVELFMYTIGASATVFSRYFISKAASFQSSESQTETSALPSWRRRVTSTMFGNMVSANTPGGSYGSSNDSVKDMRAMDHAAQLAWSGAIIAPSGAAGMGGGNDWRLAYLQHGLADEHGGVEWLEAGENERKERDSWNSAAEKATLVDDKEVGV